MATPTSRKVRDGKQKRSHMRYDGDPPYFGDLETFTSGSANADDHQPITRQASVEGTTCDVDMRDMPGKEFAHIPEEGNKPAKMHKTGIIKSSGADRGRPGGGY